MTWLAVGVLALLVCALTFAAWLWPRRRTRRPTNVVDIRPALERARRQHR